MINLLAPSIKKNNLSFVLSRIDPGTHQFESVKKVNTSPVNPGIYRGDPLRLETTDFVSCRHVGKTIFFNAVLLILDAGRMPQSCGW